MTADRLVPPPAETRKSSPPPSASTLAVSTSSTPPPTLSNSQVLAHATTEPTPVQCSEQTGGVTNDSSFQFVSRTPSDVLSRFVASFWYARGTIAYRRERIAPTGSTVAMVVLGDPISQIPNDGDGPALTAAAGFVSGPHDRPVINEPLGETHGVGIVTTPTGCEAVFGQRPATIRGQVVPLEGFWPAARGLRELLLRSESAEQALAATEEALLAELAAPPAGIERCEAAVAALEDDPTRPIADIAAEIGIPHNRLNRDFTRVVGLSPRTLASLLRVRRLLATLDVDSEIDWSQCATEFGWYDQAHLIRDFKRYTGVSPTRYVDAQRRLLVADELHDAAGFVPEM